MDITDRPDRVLGKIAIETAPQPVKVNRNVYFADRGRLWNMPIKRILPSSLAIVENISNVYGSIRDCIIEPDGAIHEVSDVRHGKDLNTHDTTTYSTTNTTLTEMLRIEYGQLITVRFLGILLVVDVSSYHESAVDYLNENNVWTRIITITAPATDTWFIEAANIKFSALRFMLRSTTSGTGSRSIQVCKIVIIKAQ